MLGFQRGACGSVGGSWSFRHGQGLVLQVQAVLLQLLVDAVLVGFGGVTAGRWNSRAGESFRRPKNLLILGNFDGLAVLGHFGHRLILLLLVLGHGLDDLHGVLLAQLAGVIQLEESNPRISISIRTNYNLRFPISSGHRHAGTWPHGSRPSHASSSAPHPLQKTPG